MVVCYNNHADMANKLPVAINILHIPPLSWNWWSIQQSKLEVEIVRLKFTQGFGHQISQLISG